ncbi:MAG: hypothetical protein ABJN57_12065 [Hyphomicrobiales bacterium]
MKNFYPLSVVFLLAATLISSALAATSQDRVSDDLSHYKSAQQSYLL